MKNSIGIRIFLVLVGAAFCSVAIQAFISPQSIMDNVQTVLPNVSALNSIRALYGGVNLFLGLFVIYGIWNKTSEALLLTALYSGGFVFGRIYSILLEGSPNEFVWTWLATESIVLIFSIWFYQKLQAPTFTPQPSH